MKNFFNKVFTLFGEKRLSTVTGAWVYYFLMSVIPLAFLLATAFSVFGINVLREVVSTLPEEFREAGEAIALTAENVSKSATVLFVATAIFSVTRLLNQMSKDGDFIYGVKAVAKRGIFRRLWAVVALASLFALFLLMAFLFAFQNLIVPEITVVSENKIALSILAFTLAIIFCYAVIIVLYKYISPVKQRLKELFLGGLCSLAIIVLGTLGLALYLRFFNSYNAVYGSLTAIVVFLLWAYIVMLGLVTGVIINKCVYEEHNKAKQKVKQVGVKKKTIKRPSAVKG